jgi:aryl-alcohol dehydrogenase-like predicted oxidoreductase
VEILKYSAIKNSSFHISRISFGCSNFGGIGSAPNLVGKGDSEKDSHHMLNMAYALGINYFDTAPTYGAGNSERILGNWIKKFNIPRDNVIISSKIHGGISRSWRIWRSGGLSKKHINKELELSLKRLQIDYLDLLYIHAPDPNTPIEETLDALSSAVDQGKVRILGASNINVDYLRQSLEVSRTNSLAKYEIVQNEYNFIKRIDEKDLIPFCVDNQIMYVGYSPLSGGLLTGKYHKGREYPENTRLNLRSELYEKILTDKTFSTIENLNNYAQSIGIALPSLMYAWLYERSDCDSFLIGVRNEVQFKALTDAIQVRLSDHDWTELDRIIGDDHNAHVLGA